MTDIHDTEINGFTLKTSRETQNIGLDRSYDLTIKNNQLINTRASGSAFKFLDNSNILIYNNDIQGAYAYWGWGNGYFGYTGPHSNIVLRDNKRSNTSGEFRWSNSPYVRSDTGGTTGPTTSTKDFTISSTTTSTAVTTDPKVYDLSLSKLNYDFNRYFAPTGAVNNPDNIGKILRAFLTDKNAADAIIGPGAETRLGQNALDEGAIKYALALTPNMVISNKPGDMEASYALLSIMKNPIEDQKLVLESIEALVMDVNKEVGSAVSPEVQKAEEELLKVVAGVLLAQGVPDLFKEEDISNIKGMFKDLGQSKDKILFDYKQSVKPYYSSVVKELAANIAVLQVKGILSKKITEEEFRKFEPREIDKIINDIRKNNDKSFEMEYILQQEGKYRTAYLDPSNKMLEARMTAMMKNLPERSTVY
jgi:hypothetical protein